MLDVNVCYKALLASDRRFDGLFYVGISTTGIYCRPICPAKKARKKSCTFFVTAAAAEHAGFRPCMRCRPEHAPAIAPYDQHSGTVAAIIARIQEGYLNGQADVESLANEFGLGERQLRRIVTDITGASPNQLAQTFRLLLAKQLLTDTQLPITRIAFASGFSSVRRFNESFATHYRMPPSRLRKQADTQQANGSLTLRLSYRPPLCWHAHLKFLTNRAIAGVEDVIEKRYRRTVAMGGHHGFIEVANNEHDFVLVVQASTTLAPVLQQLLARLRDLFDLHARPDVIDEHLSSNPILSNHVRLRPGLRVPGAFDGFELAWRAVLGQQVSVRAASTFAARFAQRFGTAIQTSYTSSTSDTSAEDAITTHDSSIDVSNHNSPDTLTRLTPTPSIVASAQLDEIASIGIPRTRATTLRDLAALYQDEPTLLYPGASIQRASQRLRAITGIGPWTVAYITMRALHWPDAFPDTDLGIKHALDMTSAADINKTSEPWRPWRAYAAMHLWTHLSERQS